MTTTNDTTTNTNTALITPEERGLAAKVDAPRIDAIAAAYPPEVREDLIWLAGWFREECKSNKEVLVQRVKRAGFKRSWNYFYQVLTGRYFRTDDGDDDPTGQIENFRQLVDKLRDGYRTSIRAGRIPFVETGTYKKIAAYITAKRMPDTVCKFGIIVGPTGGQKTACLDHYCELNNHGATIRVEAPYVPRLNQFIDDIACRYGAHIRNKKSVKEQLIAQSVRNDRTIIVDNAQRLRRPDRGYDQPSFDFLQKLQDDTGCTIILSLTPVAAKFLTEANDHERWYFEQFEGRAGGRESFLILDEWTPREDIIQIGQAFGISAAELKKPENIRFLEAISRQPGRIRILFDVLQRAKRTADRAQKELTMDHVRAARPDLIK